MSEYGWDLRPRPLGDGGEHPLTHADLAAQLVALAGDPDCERRLRDDLLAAASIHATLAVADRLREVAIRLQGYTPRTKDAGDIDDEGVARGF